MEENFIFKKNYGIKYSDLAPDMCITMSSLMEMFQDISVHHSAACGYGLKALKENNVAWLLQGWRIKILRKPEYSDFVEVITGVTDTRTVYGFRNYKLMDGKGLAVIGRATWFLLDTQTMRPCRIAGRINDYVHIENELPELEMVKLRAEEDAEKIMDFHVMRKELDTNNHLNNVKSFQFLAEILPEDFDYDEIIVTYRKPALYGERLGAYRKTIDNGYHCELKNDAGESCVIIEFFGKN